MRFLHETGVTALQQQRKSPLLPLLLCAIFLLAPLLNDGHAVVSTAITPTTGPGNLGTVVTPAGSVYTITGGTRASTNLFHSFGLFSIGAGDTANFFNNTGLQTSNIISRVTGGNLSSIFGTIQTTGFPGAHLYLLNPAGVIFGPGAQLKVEGSFHVSTADYLKFANTNGDKFFVDPANTNTVLSVDPIAAFGFLSPNTFASLTPASIEIQGSSLAVPTGQTLSVVGGDITITGDPSPIVFPPPANLKAPGGRIQIASVASAGEILIVKADGTPDLNVSSFSTLGTINISQLAHVDVSGDPGGTVVIRGGQFVLDNSTILADTRGNADGASLGVDLQVSGAVTLTDGSVILSNTFGNGNAGAITVSAGSVSLTSAVIESASLPLLDSNGTPVLTTGRAGDITVTARDAVSLDNFSRLSSSTATNGNAGNISVSAGSVSLTNGASIDSASRVAIDSNGNVVLTTGRGGDITVTATGAVSIDGSGSGLFSSTRSHGDAGAITVSAGSVSLTSGAQINTSTTTGHGGDITVTATGAVSLDGDGSSLFSSTFGNGDAGAITVLAGSVSLTNFARIDSSAETFCCDAAGNPILATGRGGDITVTATGAVSLDGVSQLISATSSHGDAGHITVSAGSVSLTNISQINSSTTFVCCDAAGNVILATGRGGDITVTATGALSLDGLSQLISATSSHGDAGHITVSAGSVRFTNGGGIDSSTTGYCCDAAGSAILTTARGGDITVMATGAVSLDDSRLSSSTATNGNAGNISVSAGSVSLTNGAFIDSASFAPFDSNGNVVLTTGRGGDIQIRAATITLDNGATISAKSTGTGKAGDITIQASDSFVARNSSVTTEATQANGGDITINVAGRLVQIINSQITTHAAGDGGNITIKRPDFIIVDPSQIIASAGVNGGDITLEATNGIFISFDSTIDASGSLGVSGTISINSPTTNLSGTLAPLSQDFMQTAALLSARCAARLSGKSSSFVVAGRDGLPPAPGDFLPSPLLPVGKAAALSMGDGEKSLQLRSQFAWIPRTGCRDF